MAQISLFPGHWFQSGLDHQKQSCHLMTIQYILNQQILSSHFPVENDFIRTPWEETPLCKQHPLQWEQHLPTSAVTISTGTTLAA